MTFVDYAVIADWFEAECVRRHQSADRRQNIEGSNFDDRLTGDAGINVIYGRSGNDVLDGGAGADVMFGADGNDTYYVDNLGDSVIEL